MPKKTLKTLQKDITKLFEQKHEVNHNNLDIFLNNIKKTVLEHFDKQDDKNYLRLSNLGLPDRRLWFDIKKGSKLSPDTYLKFLYGHIIEELLVFLIKEAGHSVTHQQKEVTSNGVTGHIDGYVDGVLVDIKSAAPSTYNKFKYEKIFRDDPFGYVTQLGSYMEAENQSMAAWIVFNKVSGDITITPLYDIQVENLEKRVETVKKALASDEKPAQCYPDVGYGKNRVLAFECSYCPHKWDCFEGLRAFSYKEGFKYFTEVNLEPRVEEVTHKIKPDASKV